MKILIAYDGTTHADAAIDDLALAGLPDTGEALVLSVADVWLPPENLQDDEDINPYIEGIVKVHRQRAHEAVAEAKTLAERARVPLLNRLPKWKVTAEGSYGSPAWEVLDRAESFGANLIVVGSHGRSALGRMILGSVSQRVLTEARSSVRVARGKVEVDPRPSNIVIAFDSSKGAHASVEVVASRHWPSRSKALIVGVVNHVGATIAGQFVPPVVSWLAEENASLEKLLEDQASAAAEKMKEIGVETDVRILSGEPKRVILQEAEAFRADCIFVGANRYGSRVERFMLGSVSAAIAARAHCSVEVVRNAG